MQDFFHQQYEMQRCRLFLRQIIHLEKIAVKLVVGGSSLDHFSCFCGAETDSQTANPEASGPELLHRKANSGYFQRKSVNIGSNFLAGTNLPIQIPHKFDFGIHHLGPLRRSLKKIH